ncbi:MAG: TIM barrel protein, partial [Opitutales bacterium]
MNRRQFTKQFALGLAVSAASTRFAAAAAKEGFKFKFIVGSSMYGELPLGEILPEVRKTGAEHLDVWPRKHGNQREQMEEMGHEKFADMLKKHRVKLGCLTHYDLGPFGLGKEMPVAKKFGCPVMVCGGKGSKKLKGADLKAAVKTFAEQMKPHLELAERHGVTIAIENHGSNLINSPDSLKWLIDLRPSGNLKIALAPYHLETGGVDAKGFGALIGQLGNNVAIYYAWQHGMG